MALVQSQQITGSGLGIVLGPLLFVGTVVDCTFWTRVLGRRQSITADNAPNGEERAALSAFIQERED
jgi:hypothetical protein